ncbi:MAG: lactonase family protein [Gemmatimonadales bacterium]
MTRIRLGLIPLLLAACSEAARVPTGTDPAGPDLSVGGGEGPGAVFILNNSAAANAVMVFPRAADGSLGAPAAYPTGGAGSGGGLGNQGALALVRGGRLLYVVNAGSDQVSAFRVTGSAISLIGTVPSGGDLPISLAVSGDLLYVLNDGGAPNVTGFRIAPDGGLAAIPGSTRPLSAAVPDAAQVGFSSDGTRLVVTEKATNSIVTWPVLADGTLGAASVQPSAGPTPFGFDFDGRGTLITSEAFGGAPNASVLSSYRPSGAGWAAVSPLVATTETAACWVVVTPNGRFAYTTNTGSASVSGFAVGHDGSLTLLTPGGVTGATSAGPIDADISVNGRFLYTLNGAGGTISAFRIESDGGLTPVGTTSGIPAGANGLVAR